MKHGCNFVASVISFAMLKMVQSDLSQTLCLLRGKKNIIARVVIHWFSYALSSPIPRKIFCKPSIICEHHIKWAKKNQMYDFRSLAKHCGMTINILCIHKLVLVWIQTPHTPCQRMCWNAISFCIIWSLPHVHGTFHIYDTLKLNSESTVCRCKMPSHDTRYEIHRCDGEYIR